MSMELLYNKIAEGLKQQIRDGVLTPGQKLPSVRKLSKEKQVSINTVLQAYLELEKFGLVVSKPQSGFYVSYSFKNSMLPATSNPISEIAEDSVSHIFSTIYNNNTKAKIVLSSGQIAGELLPVTSLTRELVKAARTLPFGGLQYERNNNEKLQRQIALKSTIWGGSFKMHNVILTSGCMHAIALCLRALLKRGDTVAVESPVHFGIINLIRNMGLNLIELPTDPVAGLDLTVLQKAVISKKIQLLIVMGNYSNPFGTCMPNEKKKELVRIMSEQNVPVIENDIYGDIHFDSHMPEFCKSYDESGIVIWCGSASKTLAGGYKTGWMEAGKFKDRILNSEPYLPTANNPIAQEAIANFMESKGYDRFKRKLNQALYQNSYFFHKAINDYFPEEIKITHPTGGIHLWVELPQHVNCLEFYNHAMSRRISIRPGRIYTSQDQFNNAITLSYGVLWDAGIEKALKVLGNICKSYL